MELGNHEMQLQLEEVLNETIKVEMWNTDDMIGLLAECEIALSSNESRIKQLETKGLKKLYYIITGVNKKNKKKVLHTMQDIQSASFEIQKILFNRIDLIASAVVYLNNKVNAQMKWSIDILDRLIRKIESLSTTTININLLKWQNNVRNLTTSDGKKYIDVSDGQKILLVVSNLFGIAEGWRNLIDRPFLETTLENLRLEKRINVSAFYESLICEKESLPLYVKEGYNYRTVNISPYGQTVYEIAEFYSDPNWIFEAKRLNRSVEDMCKGFFYKKLNNVFSEIDSVDLCEYMINDLVYLDSAFQEQIAEAQTLQLEDKEQTIDEGEDSTTMYTNKNYSIFKITAEGLWYFKEQGVSHNMFTHDPKADYEFSRKNEEEIKQRLDSGNPYMVTMPSEYYEQCLTENKNACRIEIKNLLNRRQYVSLADYYMYLWFYDTRKNERKNKKLAFIEFYDSNLYVSGYEVNESGDDYRKGFSGLRIHKSKSEETIKKLIKAQGIYCAISWEDILCFQVFDTNKHIGKKLINIGVTKVVDAWEDVLKTDNETMGKIVEDMLRNR